MRPLTALLYILTFWSRSLTAQAAGDMCGTSVLTSYDFGLFSDRFKSAVTPKQGCHLLYPTRKTCEDLKKEMNEMKEPFPVNIPVFPYCESGAAQPGKGRPMESVVARVLTDKDRLWGDRFYVFEGLEKAEWKDAGDGEFHLVRSSSGRFVDMDGKTDKCDLGPAAQKWLFSDPLKYAIGRAHMLRSVLVIAAHTIAFLGPASDNRGDRFSYQVMTGNKVPCPEGENI
ncbi:hypothetical protein NliqN6_0182 [Naganishia liquefaciens]|uniref:Uncharacterized protein n=1 Tax=Naganishia liquefaciens TaxID=104408 RepID=A0A8H3TMF8_9TREE|nr:hypothetical protein NliqN6_0182 [Naganishia liquefaciens]